MNDLVTFTAGYARAIESKLNSEGREKFPFHGDRCELIKTFMASDGYITFYLPIHPVFADAKGFQLFDATAFTLNEVAQSASLSCFRIVPFHPNVSADNLIQIPPKSERVVPNTDPYFHQDVIRGSVADENLIFPHMAVSPIVKVERGIVRSIEPRRIKIWSPTMNIPGVGRQRVYHWTHADIWFAPSKLNIDPSQAGEVAHQDLFALETILKYFPELTPEIAQKDVGNQAAELLEAACDEFVALLESNGNEEEKLHQWLKDERHHLFLDGDPSQIWSKLPFGANVSDFVVRHSDSTYLLIEIEPANERIFLKSNAEPSARFNHACQQVRDWQRYIRENVHTARNELKLTDIYEPKGMVLMGRITDIDSDEANNRWRDMKNNHEFTILTYDDVIDRVRGLASRLKNLQSI